MILEIIPKWDVLSWPGRLGGSRAQVAVLTAGKDEVRGGWAEDGVRRVVDAQGGMLRVVQLLAPGG